MPRDALAAPLKSPEKWAKQWSGSDATTARLPDIVQKNPKFRTILEFPQRHRHDSDLWFLACLIELWLYGRSGAIRVDEVSIRTKEGEPPDKDGNTEVRQVIRPVDWFQGGVFAAASSDAKTAVQNFARELTVKALLDHPTRRDLIGRLYTDLQRRLTRARDAKSKSESAVEARLGDLTFKHNPTVYVGNVVVTTGTYIGNALWNKKFDVSSFATLHKFVINYYAVFNCALSTRTESKQRTEILTITITMGATRLYDSFDFKTEQPLFFWKTSDSVLDYTYLNNAAFRDFATKVPAEYNRLNPHDIPLVCQDFYLATPIEKVDLPAETKPLVIHNPKTVFRAHGIPV